ncbi:Protein Y55F3AM.13 [Aphelenchoides avenae]|nr:Protein Y55F3AM.13 [Aphelenchus avenae]
MYRLAPYFPDIEVKPKPVLYYLPPYHSPAPTAQLNGLLENGTPQEENGTASDFAAQQRELIARLSDFNKQLDRFLDSAKTPAGSEAELASTSTKGDKSGAKKAKKEEKKDKKAAAKGATKEKSPAKVDAEAVSSAASLQTFQASVAADSPRVLYARLRPTVRHVAVHEYKRELPADATKLELECSAADSTWLKMLDEAGKDRGVLFDFAKDSKKVSSVAKITIAVKMNDKAKGIRLTSADGKLTLTDRIAVWKLLGEWLGLYSAVDTFTATHADRWLLEASAQLAGQLPLDELNRRLGAFLGRSDYLTATNAVLLPDVLLVSLFPADAQVSSNVELWKRRVVASVENLRQKL